jgi:hypothetical protein
MRTAAAEAVALLLILMDVSTAFDFYYLSSLTLRSGSFLAERKRGAGKV